MKKEAPDWCVYGVFLVGYTTKCFSCVQHHCGLTLGPQLQVYRAAGESAEGKEEWLDHLKTRPVGEDRENGIAEPDERTTSKGMAWLQSISGTQTTK